MIADCTFCPPMKGVAPCVRIHPSIVFEYAVFVMDLSKTETFCFYVVWNP